MLKLITDAFFATVGVFFVETSVWAVADTIAEEVYLERRMEKELEQQNKEFAQEWGDGLVCYRC